MSTCVFLGLRSKTSIGNKHEHKSGVVTYFLCWMVLQQWQIQAEANEEVERLLRTESALPEYS